MLKKYPNILKVIYLSVVLFLFQAIANSLMGILSQITHQNNRDWAGPVTTMLLFFFSGVGALYNKYLHKFQYRYIMYIGSLGYTFYVGSSIVFILIGESESLGILVGVFLLTIVSGLIVSGMYNGQFNYVNLCAVADSTTVYFGINIGIVQASNIFGNILSSFTIQKLGQLHYCIMMTVLIFCISLGFLLVRNVKSEVRDSQITDNNQQIQTKQLVQDTTNKSLYHLLPPFYFSGVLIACVYTFISVLMYRTFPNMPKLELNSLTFKVMIFQGLGQLSGGLLVIFVADRYKKILQLLGLVNMGALSLVLLYAGSMIRNIYLIGFGCFLIGIADCGVFSLDLALVSSQNYSNRGYSAFNFFQCLGVMISLIVVISCSSEVFVAYVIVCQIMSSYALHTYR